MTVLPAASGNTPTAQKQFSRAVRCLRPWILGGAWASITLLIIAYPIFPTFLSRYQFVPFVFGMVFLGLPHGAMDHLVIPLEKRRRLTAPYLAAFFAGYLGLTLLYLFFWHALPTVALGVFLLLSWLHWGQGDAYALHVFLGRPLPQTKVRTGLIWAVRGALPIILPPLAFPAVFQAFAQGMLAWQGSAGQHWTLTPGVRAAGFVLLIVLALWYALAAWQDYSPSRKSAFWADIFEVILLATLFLSVPPILAVGVYFCVWHAARHIARLMLLEPVVRAGLAQGKLGQSVKRSAWLSLPMTVAALAILGGLYGFQTHKAADMGSFVYFYLALIAALTFPHFLLVIWMDRQELA